MGGWKKSNGLAPSIAEEQEWSENDSKSWLEGSMGHS